MLWSKHEVKKDKPKETKKVHVNGEDKDHKEDDYVDEYEENLKLKKDLEFKDQLLAALTKACDDKDQEIKRLRDQLDGNTKFLQSTINELIVKLSAPAKEAPRSLQMEQYLASKNAAAVASLPKK